MIVITYFVVMCVAVRRALFEFDTLRFMMPWRVECPTFLRLVKLNIDDSTNRRGCSSRLVEPLHVPGSCQHCLAKESCNGARTSER